MPVLPNPLSPLPQSMTEAIQARMAALAYVPEHSLSLMTALSQGEPFIVGPYFFLAAEDWLMAIAYPLEGNYEHNTFKAALEESLNYTGATSCFAIGPHLLPRLEKQIVDRDRYYVLPAHGAVPSRLRGPLKKAAASLTISEGEVFTAEHRRLWAEFLGRAQRGEAATMAPHVTALYARAPHALASAGGSLRLLDARDENGRLAACLLLDYAPQNFVSYVLGAHSRSHAIPHATDLLFAAMLNNAKKAGKRFIHLGLGVNEGILRFKRKWGARPSFPYVMAQWDEAPQRKAFASAQPEEENVIQNLALACLRAPEQRAKLIEDRPNHRPFAMLWQVEKNGKTSWIGGTAHFFCHSFEPSFRQLFGKVDHVIFEGPLDEDFMAEVERAGRTPSPGTKSILEMLDESDILRLERVVHGPKGIFARAFGLERTSTVDVRWLLANARPWCSFFSLWTAFLERQGWRDSVDMEAWRVAHAMGKNVVGMESLEEQLDSLSSLPPERVVRFFRACDGWKSLSRKNIRTYLAGDLEAMMGSSAEFPTRTEYVVSRRDQRFRERMRPYLEDGRCAVFVGAAHMLNLRHMLVEDGFSVRQSPFGLFPALKLKLRRLLRKGDVFAW